MKESATATLSSANNRAFSTSVKPCADAAVSAIWFQTATAPLFGPTPQNWATTVCSGVRVLGVVVPFPPRALTSSNAAVYSGLVKAGGGPGLNWSPPVMANGVTSGHCGTTGFMVVESGGLGGVGR